MKTTVDPAAVAAAAVRAVAQSSQTVGLFAESSSAMFYVTRALSKLEAAPYFRFSSHYGSMGHGIAGALGFCAATGQRALVVTGDGSFDLMNPLRAAVKHRLPLTLIVLNDARLTLPFFGSGSIGAWNAQATTELACWDYTRQGSPEVGGRRVFESSELDSAISDGLSWDGCYVVDVQVDPEVTPPVGTRLDSVDALFGLTRR
jgi:thiamine pyrophosphate-dependent acetolactate synthase large subunit-like protein